MRVSVITTVLNERKTIQSFMDALKNQSRKPDEIVVVDGGSTDGTINYIGANANVIYDSECNIAYCDSPVARGRNIAIRQATGDVIAVTDAGCIPNKYWLEEIVKPFEDENVMVVSGNCMAIQTTWFHKIIAPFMPRIKDLKDNPSSRSIAFRKLVWKAVGGYPEVALTAEDTLFNQMWDYAHFKSVFADKAIVFWRMSPNLKHFVRQQYRYSKGDAISDLRLGTHIEMALRLGFLFGSFFLGVGWYVLSAYFLYLLLWKGYVNHSLFSAPMKIVLDASRVAGFIVGQYKRICGKNW